jgi:hypothetical protein
MALEIVRRRFLTDAEIYVIQERERLDKLLDEIRDQIAYDNRNEPPFSPVDLSRRRLLKIAGLSAASLSIAAGLTYPAAARTDLGSVATLIGKWNTSQPQLDEARIPAKSGTIAAEAPVTSTVNYTQPLKTVVAQLEDTSGVLEDSQSQPVSLEAYEELIFRYALRVARTIPPGRKRLLFFTKIARIFATLNVVDA